MKNKKFEKFLKPEAYLELKNKVKECELKNFEERDNKLYLDGEEYTGEYYFIEEKKCFPKKEEIRKILHKLTYSNGKKHGIERCYREDGSLSLENEFFEGDLRKREFGNIYMTNKFWLSTDLGFSSLERPNNKNSLNIEYYANGEVHRIKTQSFYELEEKIYLNSDSRTLDKAGNLEKERFILYEIFSNDKKAKIVLARSIYYYPSGKLKIIDEEINGS